MIDVHLKQLQALAQRHARSPWHPWPSLPGLALMASSEVALPFGHVCQPALIVVLQGMQRTVIGTRVLDCRAGQYLVNPVDMPMDARIARASADEPFLAVRFALKPEAIATVLLDAGVAGASASPSANANDTQGLAVGDMHAELADALLRLLKLLDAPADIPVLAAALEREVLWRLLGSSQGEMVRQIGMANSRMTQIGNAIRHLRGAYADRIKVQELAAVAGMSATSFHRHFRAVTSMTPIQYQKQLRLQAARAKLLAADADVAVVAFAVGYDNPSQFNREYKRLFGKPPGQDGKILRQAVQAA